MDVAKGLAVSKVHIKYTSRAFRHQLETGNTVVDARIIMPLSVDIDCYAQTIDQISALNTALMDRTATYTISSKGLVVPLMMMNSDTMRQTPDVLTAASQHLTFSEALINGQPLQVCEQSPDASIMDRGLVYIQQATQQVSDLVSNIELRMGI